MFLQPIETFGYVPTIQFGNFCEGSQATIRLLTSSRRQLTDGFLSFFFKLLNASSLKSRSGFFVPSSLVSSIPMHIANKTAHWFDCSTRTRSDSEGSLSMSMTTILLEDSSIDKAVELDADMMGGLGYRQLLLCAKRLIVVVVGWIKVQLLGNESLSRVCFLELGHFGLIPPVLWRIKSVPAQKTELMGYRPSCISKNLGFSYCRNIA
jgi:hypothetical protein